MADEELKLDGNRRNVAGGITDDANGEVRNLRVNPDTNRLEVDVASDDFMFGFFFIFMTLMFSYFELENIDDNTGWIADDTWNIAIDTASMDNKFGEVDDTPTVNTLLGRIKALETLTTSLETLITSIKDTDGIKKIEDLVIASVLVLNQGKIDSISSNFICMTHEHNKVHESKLFMVGDYDDNIDTGSPKIWRFTTPNSSKVIHADIWVSCSAGALIEFLEAPTLNVAGNALTVFNLDRNSAVTATATAFKNTTITADGTALPPIHVGGNFILARFGGETDGYMNLKLNTSYVIRITPDADNLIASFRAKFYEV